MGIGTLGERTLHATLKRFLEPDTSKHEIPFGGYVADILNESGITEIQTRGIYHMKVKLEALLAETNVTLVHPVSRQRWIIWLDPATGEQTSRRKSPKLGKPCDALYELSSIAHLIPNERLKVRIIMVDVEEYRRLDGWSRDKKKGSTRAERIPIELGETIELDCPADYVKLLPENLPELFTIAEFAKAARMTGFTGGISFKLLRELGIVVSCGKRGRAGLWRVNRDMVSINT